MKNRSAGKISAKWVPIFCIFSFIIGVLITNRTWATPESSGQLMIQRRLEQEVQAATDDFTTTTKKAPERDVMERVFKTHEALQ
ncbi:putative beta-1,3-galactosyltransferase 5 [Morella rubra]|uniref:Putative beta-1,3-galactosyltransferase 5 n=1 Tax=Morella rubra TaxID=262757 RepID=A0A6A1UYE0_9ROSI|nr:putative beta-1,3-galactosyltransferase 5 [Morella rubra]